MTPTSSLVLVIHQYDWHAPILDPIADLLAGRHQIVAMTTTAYMGGGQVFAPEPDLIIVADAGTAVILRSRLPDTKIIHVGHGLISKNIPGQAYKAADYVCVASRYVAERLTRQGHVPRRAFLSTGLIQSDPLFHDTPRERGVRVPGCTVSVAYAPTWNPSLSSAPMLGEEAISLIRGENDGIGIVIKPHPHIAASAPQWIDAWRALTKRHPNVVMHPPEADLIPVLLGADLLISDASSAIFHFLALNRPIVLIDNPERFATPHCYDPNGIEWKWRDIATCVERVADLEAAVAVSLAHPERHEVQRLVRRTALFGERTDGRARDRVAAEVDRILGGGKP